MKYHSVQDKEWIVKTFDKNSVELISKKYNLDFLTSKLLAIRNINSENINSFLDPKIKNFLPNPFRFKDMDNGLDVVANHLKKNPRYVYLVIMMLMELPLVVSCQNI